MTTLPTADAVPCLALRTLELPWLVVEDTPAGREQGLMCMLGEDWSGPNNVGMEMPDSLLVRRVTYTREQLENLPEWSP